MQEIEKAKKISGYCWKAFKRFMESPHADADWEEFIEAGQSAQGGFEEQDINLFVAMFMAFMNYAEDSLKKRGN